MWLTGSTGEEMLAIMRLRRRYDYNTGFLSLPTSVVRRSSMDVSVRAPCGAPGVPVLRTFGVARFVAFRVDVSVYTFHCGLFRGHFGEPVSWHFSVDTLVWNFTVDISSWRSRFRGS